jgi:lambda repressor-like predicted transcriptional regulator
MIKLATRIKIEILKKGISGAEIARQAGVTRVAIYHVIEGRSNSIKLRSAIADALGVRVSDLWPRQTPRRRKAA